MIAAPRESQIVELDSATMSPPRPPWSTWSTIMHIEPVGPQGVMAAKEELRRDRRAHGYLTTHPEMRKNGFAIGQHVLLNRVGKRLLCSWASPQPHQ